MTITIDATSVATINGTGQYVTLVSCPGAVVSTSDARPGPAQAVVAWLVMKAAQTITISWSPSYLIFATSATLTTGDIVTMEAFTAEPAEVAALYTFNSSNLFVSPVPGQAERTFNVSNQVGSNNWQFGLAQMATISGSPTPRPVPLNIVPVLNNETATFTPSETVHVFLQSCANNGAIIPKVPGQACAVQLATGSTAIVEFNSSSNIFFVN